MVLGDESCCSVIVPFQFVLSAFSMCMSILCAIAKLCTPRSIQQDGNYCCSALRWAVIIYQLGVCRCRSGCVHIFITSFIVGMNNGTIMKTPYVCWMVCLGSVFKFNRTRSMGTEHQFNFQHRLY